MKKKKILAVIAAATMALSMVGCGSSGGGSSSSGVANSMDNICFRKKHLQDAKRAWEGLHGLRRVADDKGCLVLLF